MRKEIWYGYLEAGQKSTPVVFDRRLPTGDEESIYLFNLARREILEYQRHIVEPKLRELKAEEAALVEQLKLGYTKARNNFRSRGNRVLHLPAHNPTGEEGLEPKARDKINGFVETDSADVLEAETWFNESS